MGNCIGCAPGYIETPDDSVYYTGPDFPELGIKAGMTYKALVAILLRFIPAQGTDVGTVSASDVIVESPPAFLMTEYSKCWDKISDQKGWYLVSDIGGSRVFSYDFVDAISSLPHNMELRNISVNITTMDKGIRKTYVTTEKASNAFTFDQSNFPIGFSVSITVGSNQCSDTVMYLNLSIGNIPFEEKRFFLFSVKGHDAASGVTQYKLKDVMDMSNAKLAQLSNFANTIQAGEYLSQINFLRLQNEALAAKISQPKRYEIGTGLSKLSLTEEEFVAYVTNEIKSLRSKIERLQPV